MAPFIEKLLDGFTLGEGPHWDDKRQCLYFVDIFKNSIHRYVPSTKQHTQATIGSHVSIIIPIKNKENEFIVTLDNTIASIYWDGESDKVKILKKLFEVDQKTQMIFNDGKCDKTGRLWIGTMSTETLSLETINKNGNLYSFQNNEVKIQRSEIGITNGLAFDYKRNKMFYIDSSKKSIDQYDIDFKTATITNLNQIFENEKCGLKAGDLLDGMTIDTDGNLWVAVFNSSRVYKINPNIPNTVLQYIEFPAIQITSVAFGGPNLDELYVTSGNIKSIPAGESPGLLFRVTGLNTKGLQADEAVV